jgi:RND family efflux transporter MFP subunit
VVESLQARVADTEVRAPQDGVVLAKQVELGEVVAVNQPLFRVGDTARLVLEVMVDEADISRVRDGSAAAISLYAYAKRTFGGSVFEIEPDANRERKAFLVKIRLDEPPEGLRSGMTAEVNVVVGRKEDVLLAPGESEADGHVWVVEGGRARRKPVSIGARDLLRFEITGGLAEGDVVVVDGQPKLTEGARVVTTVRRMDRLQAVPDPSQPKSTLSGAR